MKAESSSLVSRGSSQWEAGPLDVSGYAPTYHTMVLREQMSSGQESKMHWGEAVLTLRSRTVVWLEPCYTTEILGLRVETNGIFKPPEYPTLCELFRTPCLNLPIIKQFKD